jgi:DNA-binding MurR/RpiR family transcriptional regulator
MTRKTDTQTLAPPENFDALRQRIRERFGELSPHLQRIARASLEEPNTFALGTTPAISEQLQIQPSTLIRFAKEFGFSGYTDLQKVFRQRLIEGQANTRDKVLERDAGGSPPDTRATLEACIAAHQASIARLAEECDVEALSRAIGLMRDAPHVYVAGLRRSRPIADYFHYGMLRGERPSTILDFAGGMAGPQIATMGPEDVLFAIAFAPHSKHVVDAVMDAHLSGRRIVTLTDSAESPLARHGGITLLISTDAESRFQPISGAIALVQTLVTAITRP